MTAITSQRFHGKNARVFVGATSTAAASPVAYAAAFTIDSSTDRSDATAFGDKNKKGLAGLPGASGTLTGFSDLAGDVLYTASVDGLGRKTYFYKDYVNHPEEYFHGLCNWSNQLTVPVNGTATISANWEAESDLLEVLPS